LARKNQDAYVAVSRAIDDRDIDWDAGLPTTRVPAGGDCAGLTAPQLLLMQPELVRNERLGMYAGQAFVERTLAPALCKQAQLTLGGVGAHGSHGLADQVAVSQRSVRSQVRVIASGQRLLVTVPAIVTNHVRAAASVETGRLMRTKSERHTRRTVG